jgi:adenine/guanine phosphoribosyltransferase-like PRPP-binding protein
MRLECVTSELYKNYDKNEFFLVERKNNPKRKYGLVHKSLGKVKDISIDEINNFVINLIGSKTPNTKMPIIGLSESSIILARAIAEIYKSEKCLFSTRENDKLGLSAFREEHSHAPNHYLNLDEIRDVESIFIVEDEVTTGKTLFNLIKNLKANLRNLKKVYFTALKIFLDTDKKLEFIEKCFELNIELIEHITDGLTPKSNEISITNDIIELQSLEDKRGRLEIFSYKNLNSRYVYLDKMFDYSKVFDIDKPIIVFGISEAIDLAYEISNYFYMNEFNVKIRHVTISPWNLENLKLESTQKSSSNLYMYNVNIDDYNNFQVVIVCDQDKYKNQVNKLKEILDKNCEKVLVL